MKYIWTDHMNPDEYFMEQALAHAKNAYAAGEFPVGCVIADKNSVVASGARTGSLSQSPNELDHAEINALRQLYEQSGASDRSELSIYCTMEPCLMCFAAIVLSGIQRIVYAYEDIMGGGTQCPLNKLPSLYRRSSMTVVPHVMRGESLALFKAYFLKPDNLYWKDSLLSQYTLAQK